MKHPAFVGGFGMALTFCTALFLLPAAIFLAVAAAAPALILGRSAIRSRIPNNHPYLQLPA